MNIRCRLVLEDFQLCTHVDDYANKLPTTWQQHGGVLIPMYQSEALWIRFSGHYPCAVKIAAGKIDAVSGGQWTNRLTDEPQDYVVIPEQPWLDGFNVTKEHVRQFVAMPLGDGFTAEEQITGKADHGGLQIIVYPMKRDVYIKQSEMLRITGPNSIEIEYCENLDMGLAPGGLMRQMIYEDEYGIDAWDLENGYRCFIHLANSAMFQSITGQLPPHAPLTAKEYTEAGLPWFEYYSDAKAICSAGSLGSLKSVAAKIIEKDKMPMADNDPINPKHCKTLRARSTVRDGVF